MQTKLFKQYPLVRKAFNEYGRLAPSGQRADVKAQIARMEKVCQLLDASLTDGAKEKEAIMTASVLATAQRDFQPGLDSKTICAEYNARVRNLFEEKADCDARRSCVTQSSEEILQISAIEAIVYREELIPNAQTAKNITKTHSL